MTDRERDMLKKVDAAKTLVDWIDTVAPVGSEDYVESLVRCLDKMEEITGRKSAELKGLTVRCDLCSRPIPAEEAPALCDRCGRTARAHVNVDKSYREWQADGSP